MIEELAISDLGVIAQTTLPLGPGFTAITGETGAGKTMVVSALGLLMGERSDASLVRAGAKQARVSGVIEVHGERVAEIVADAGGELDGDALYLTRTVPSDGSSRASVGGVRAPAGVLQELATELFCVHGQAEQLRLRSQTEQRQTLDRFGGSAIAQALQEYQECFVRYQQLQQEHDEIVSNREERRREAERLQAEIRQISDVDPQPGETESLQQQLEKLTNAEDLRLQLVTALNALSGEADDVYAQDAQTMLANAASAARSAGSYDAGVQEIAVQLEELLAGVQSVVGDLHQQLDQLDMAGPAALEAAQSRLAQLRQIERVFGPTLADACAYLEQANARLLTLSNDDSRLENIAQDLAVAASAKEKAAAHLSGLRQDAAAQLGRQVTAELQALALPEAVLEIQVRQAAPAMHGVDEVLFMLVPHPGAEPRPLAKAASGGELSRIMLALEVVIAAVDNVPTFVFDEIDAGIGGVAAIEVGKRLARLAQQSQVIVVTHLPQVAAFANNHLRVVKDSSGGFTESSCQQLSGAERTREIARLLSGLTDSAAALEHAEELLAMGAGEG